MALASERDLVPRAAVPGARTRERLAADPGFCALLLVVLALPLGLAAGRGHLSFGVETDFLGLFVPEAKRLLAGEPLLIAFHLPLYPAALALVWSLLGDWVAAGIALSLLAAGVSAFATWWLSRRLFGAAAGLGRWRRLPSSARPYLARRQRPAPTCSFWPSTSALAPWLWPASGAAGMPPGLGSGC